MLNLNEFEERINSCETVDIEFKSAKGGIPGSFWETYSSFANTQGGDIFLGVKEVADGFVVDGLDERQASSYQKQLWDCLNNRNKVSVNVLSNQDVEIIKTAQGCILAVRVPRADLKSRPVYIDNRPEKVFKREHEGDYQCSQDEIRRMYAEANILEQPQDARILEGFNFEEDIDKDAFRKYRQVFTNQKPTHPWSSLPDIEFMTMLGGFGKDRKTGKEGLTLAGMLMFGKMNSITDPYCCPAYFPDYRKTSINVEERWADRICWDGSWEANLFNFYNRVYNKLTEMLPQPFALKDGVRIEDSPMHVAIREAFVNTLIHCDYTIDSNIVIENQITKFVFVNPGSLLVSLNQYFKGGESVCRNKSLQKMFMLIGSAEKAGSGASKIWKGWKSANYRNPSIDQERGKVVLEMPLATILSDDVLDELQKYFGENVLSMEQPKLLVLAACVSDGFTTNYKLQFVLDMHPSDITLLLRELCQKGYLKASGFGKGTRYQLNVASNVSQNVASNVSQNVASNVSQNVASNVSQDRNPLLAKHNRNKRTAKLYAEIVEACHDFEPLIVIAPRVNRSLRYLKNKVIPDMVAAGMLIRKYPTVPNHPDQQYKSNH
jgi:predicted HTH transcriptional regulator